MRNTVYCVPHWFHVTTSDVNKTFFVKTKTKTKTLGLKTKTKTKTSIFFKDQDQDFLVNTKTKTFSFKTLNQDFTRTTEQVTMSISWSQNEQNSIHTTRIAVYEIKTVA